MVQWDLGTRALYRCGEDEKFDLRVFDAAPTGLQFPNVVCSGCYVEGVAGIHWQCAHCHEYHLCHSCYLLGRHCQEHPFFRVESKEQAARVKMSCRAGAKRAEAKGVFVGAEVVRGPHWRFGDQDGGAGKIGRVVAIEGWKTATSRSVAKVEWGAGGPANIYRVGHKGKMDLCCTSSASGGYYYVEHQAILGLSAAVTIFDMEEIVAGDLVMVELDVEVFRLIHEAAGRWNDGMTVVLNQPLYVLSILDDQRLAVTNYSINALIVCSDSVTKLKHCRVGQTVRVISDVSRLRQRHIDSHIWKEKMIATAGQIGCVTKIYFTSRVQVYVQGRVWLFDPLCLEPAPGKTATYTPDPKNENLGMSNVTRNDSREQVMAAGITDEALLSGDLNTIECLVYNNETLAEVKETLLNYYAMMGLTEALRRCLKSDIDQIKIDMLLTTCIARNLTESVTVILEEGAVVGIDSLIAAVAYANPSIVRACATSPGVMIDAQDSSGDTAIQAAGAYFRNIPIAIMLAAGANPTVCSDAIRCLIHEGALRGSAAIMEVLVVHSNEHLNLMSSDGFAPFHYAAFNGNTQVCSILAAQASVNINIQAYETKFTPLHLAIEMSRWSVVECLVGWGALLNLVDRNGNTPLHRVIKLKSVNSPGSPHIEQVRKELSVASGGRAVEGYIAVACFLVREGADWHIKNKEGVSPHQALPPAVAALISEYLKEFSGPKMFYSSLRREQQEHRLQELPLRLKLPPRVPSSAAAAVLSVTATDNLSSKAKEESISKASYEPESTKTKSELLSRTKLDKNTKVMAASKTSASSRPLVVDRQPPPDSPPSVGPTVSSPTSELPSVQPSGLSRQPCLLCEDYPANIRFIPCGHTVLCRMCAERAKKCLHCKAYVESKSIDSDQQL